jgi:hypothetical protein
MGGMQFVPVVNINTPGTLDSMNRHKNNKDDIDK